MSQWTFVKFLPNSLVFHLMSNFKDIECSTQICSPVFLIINCCLINEQIEQTHRSHGLFKEVIVA